jgi:hypothetical protein
MQVNGTAGGPWAAIDELTVSPEQNIENNPMQSSRNDYELSTSEYRDYAPTT